MQSSTMNNAIEIDRLTRSFGAVHAVAGLTMRVPAGRIYGLIGADGAGKTTTLRILCGALLPDGGRATIMGIDVARDPEGVRRRIGFMRAGALMASGTPRELQKLVHGVVLELQIRPLHEAQVLLSAMPGVHEVQVFGDRLHLIADAALPEADLREQLERGGATLGAVRPVQPTMEDV